MKPHVCKRLDLFQSNKRQGSLLFANPDLGKRSASKNEREVAATALLLGKNTSPHTRQSSPFEVNAARAIKA